MIKAVFLGALALACAFVFSLFFSVPGWSAGLHPRCNVDWPCIMQSAEKVKTERSGLYSAEDRRAARGQSLYNAMPFGMPTAGAAEGARFIRGRLVCALNVGAELARRGIRGTGSALAKSYLLWGRGSGPVPGAVAVFGRGKRGGHVAIVHSVRSDGTVIYLNPSSRRQAWQVGPYHKRPIAFRVASY